MNPDTVMQNLFTGTPFLFRAVKSSDQKTAASRPKRKRNERQPCLRPYRPNGLFGRQTDPRTRRDAKKRPFRTASPTKYGTFAALKQKAPYRGKKPENAQILRQNQNPTTVITA